MLPPRCCSNCGFLDTHFEPRPPSHLSVSHPLFTTNDPPADSEIPVILDFISARKQLLDSLNAKITAVASTMDSLVKERDAVVEDVRSHAAVVSPLRRMPTEIVCRILSMSLSPVVYCEIPEVPWHLGHISKHWRETAVALPCLWSSFGIQTAAYLDRENRTKKPDSEPGGSAPFREQLRRSGHAPLQITILGQGYSAPERLLVLLSATERWEMLVGHEKGLKFLLHWDERTEDALLLQTPLLRRLHLTYADRWLPPAVYEFDIPWPSLSDHPLPSDSLPWENLTRYDGTFKWGTFVQLLRRASRLVECRIIISADPLPRHHIDDIAHLPQLKRLRVSSTQCLRNIHAPGLQELAVQMYRTDDPTDIFVFLERSACTLLRLSLLGCGEASLLLPILRATPSIRELVITRPSSKDPGMVSLLHSMVPATLTSGEAPLLPNLTAISFGDIHEFPIGPAVDMIAARFGNHNGYSQLRFFGLLIYRNNVHFRKTEVWKVLGRMQSEGLELGMVRGSGKYDRMLITDAYSVERCKEYTQLMTSDLPSMMYGIERKEFSS